MSSRTRTSNEIGRDAEERVVRALGGRLVPGSGNGKFVKLDVKDSGKFIYSVKATEKIRDTAMRAISKLWRETIQGARNFNGHGNDAKPAMVFEMPDGELLCLCRLEDHRALATGEIQPYLEPDKAATRRARTVQNPRNL